MIKYYLAQQNILYTWCNMFSTCLLPAIVYYPVSKFDTHVVFSKCNIFGSMANNSYALFLKNTLVSLRLFLKWNSLPSKGGNELPLNPTFGNVYIDRIPSSSTSPSSPLSSIIAHAGLTNPLALPTNIPLGVPILFGRISFLGYVSVPSNFNDKGRSGVENVLLSCSLGLDRSGFDFTMFGSLYRMWLWLIVRGVATGWLAGFTVIIRLWLLAIIMSVTWSNVLAETSIPLTSSTSSLTASSPVLSANPPGTNLDIKIPGTFSIPFGVTRTLVPSRI